MHIINTYDVDKKEILDFLEHDGSMELAHIQATIMAKKNRRYLDMHPYAITHTKNGKWSTYLPSNDGKRKKVTRNTEEEIIDIVVDYWKEKELDPRVHELFEQWNGERLEDELISKRSYDRYDQVFKRHFTEVSGKRISKVSIESIIKFMKTEKRDKRLNKKAFNLLKSTVVGIIETADDMECLSFDFMRFQNELRKFVKKMKFRAVDKPDEDEVFDDIEYGKIICYLRDNLDTKNTALLLMFVTGMRVGELVALKHSAIRDDHIRICRSETRYKNGDRYVYEVQEHPKTDNGFRDVVLPEQYSFLYDRMKLLNPFGEYVFTNEFGERYTVNSISRRLNTICKKIGIKPRSPNKARKTIGTIYFDAKLDRKLILNQMGWSGEAVGENHYHRNRKTNEKKIKIISSIPDFAK